MIWFKFLKAHTAFWREWTEEEAQTEAGRPMRKAVSDLTHTYSAHVPEAV